MMGSVNSIESFGLVDGPGIRTVVFLNGCLLRCEYCHNPEMWVMQEHNILAENLAKIIIRNKPYFLNNGGVTFSGGEPLIQSKFIIEVCKILKEENIHIALDTAGVGSNYDELLPYIDLVIFDVKHIDKDRYFNLTGYPIDSSLAFLEKVIEHQKKIWIRQVIIPGINDNYDYIKNLKTFIKNIPLVEKVEFLPFHRLGKEKYEALNIPYSYENKEAMDKNKCNELYNYFISI